MEAIKLIGTAIAMLIGLILTPIITGAVEVAVRGEIVLNDTGVGYYNKTPVANITGLTEVLELVPYVYVFVIIGAGLLVMYHFYKG